MSPVPSEVSTLVSIITSAASTIESHHKTNQIHVPSLDGTEPHPPERTTYPLDVRHAVQALEGACVQLCAAVTRPGHTMLNSYMRIFESASIGVALRGGVADLLSDRPSRMHVTEISKRCGIEHGKLGRVMRLLCSSHIFREVSRDVFANNRISMQLLKSSPLSDMGFLCSEEYITKGVFSLANDPDSGHSYAVQDSCFNRTSGYPLPLWIYFEGKDEPRGAESGARFGRGMAGWNTEVTDAAEVLFIDYPWEKLSDGTTINDVGGGIGSISLPLCKGYPRLRLKLQDLPERIEEAKNEVWPQACPEAIAGGRIEFKAIDFLKESPISNCDIYLNIIHDWPDEEAIKIPSNISSVMAPSSWVLLYEYIIQRAHRLPDIESKIEQAPSPVLPNYGTGRIRQYSLDIAFMTLFHSKARGLDDYIELGRSAVLQFVKLWDLGEMGLVEFELPEHRGSQS